MVENDEHLHGDLDQKETLGQGNGRPENVARVAQLSGETHHQQDETVETHSHGNDGRPVDFLSHEKLLAHDGELEHVERNICI
jgi:hypothetical protein